MRFSMEIFQSTAVHDCRIAAEGIADVLLLDDYSSMPSFLRTVAAYVMLNNLSMLCEKLGEAVVVSCGHGPLARFTPIN